HREVDVGQKLRVEQRAVHRALCVVDAEPLAQRIEAVAFAGEEIASERECIDHARMEVATFREHRLFELEVEECEVERRVVDDPFGALGEGDELGGYLAERSE